LTATGATLFMTTEVVGEYPHVRFTTEKVSFITDDIIVQRFVEIDGALRSVLAIHKMRGSAHSRDFRTYDIGPNGAVMGGPLRNYRGIMTGVPELELRLPRPARAGLTVVETAVLDTLIRLGSATRDALAERAGLLAPELGDILERLQGLGYAAASPDGPDAYRAIAHRGE
jgi:hypothetical protein